MDHRFWAVRFSACPRLCRLTLEISLPSDATALRSCGGTVLSALPHSLERYNGVAGAPIKSLTAASRLGRDWLAMQPRIFILVFWLVACCSRLGYTEHEPMPLKACPRFGGPVA
jgi:hypothetical protein